MVGLGCGGSAQGLRVSAQTWRGTSNQFGGQLPNWARPCNMFLQVRRSGKQGDHMKDRSRSETRRNDTQL